MSVDLLRTEAGRSLHDKDLHDLVGGRRGGAFGAGAEHRLVEGVVLGRVGQGAGASRDWIIRATTRRQASGAASPVAFTTPALAMDQHQVRGVEVLAQPLGGWRGR